MPPVPEQGASKDGSGAAGCDDDDETVKLLKAAMAVNKSNEGADKKEASAGTGNQSTYSGK